MTIDTIASGSGGNNPKQSFLRPVKYVLAISAIMAVCTMLGCFPSSSLSDSSESFTSSVKSSSSSFTSSSGESKEAYLRDIKQYTAAYTRSNSDMTGLWRGVSTISAHYGVTNWEADSATYEGIGAGLAKAAVTLQQFEHYRDHLAQGDARKMAAIQLGYGGEH